MGSLWEKDFNDIPFRNIYNQLVIIINLIFYLKMLIKTYLLHGYLLKIFQMLVNAY